MEFVDGPTVGMKTADELGLDDTGIFNLVEYIWLRPLNCTDNTPPQADSLFLTIYEMHECGIIHNDIKEDNVIILFDPSNQHCVGVLLDFAMCTALESPSSAKVMIELDIEWWVDFSCDHTPLFTSTSFISIGSLLMSLGVEERGIPWLQSRLQSNHPYVEVLAALDRLHWLRPLPPVERRPEIDCESL
jgi:serine/threonine protein kinase